jgi:hypothetical protein
MGCNAWNHPADCDCGWGGDTGGGYGGDGGVRSLKVVDGHAWRIDRRPSAGAFVNPNAVCPVCGEPVFFYRSPEGGRVFFDALGPPWPKHPCTDNSGLMIVGPTTIADIRVDQFRPRDWRPLAAVGITQCGSHDRLAMPKDNHLPKNCLFVPTGWAGDAPSFWRWYDNDRKLIEVSCVRVDMASKIDSRIHIVPSWVGDREELEAWLRNPATEPSPAALNAIGFALSFAWRIKGDFWATYFKAVDLPAAKRLFEQSALAGYWPALNNLGVMYEHGLGLPVDKSRAFEFYRQAAQSLNPVPLKHLARCHREGIGCEINLIEADMLDELSRL